MRFFSKKESFVVFGILLVIILISLVNFRISLRRSRDAQRKDDLRLITDTLSVYREEVGFLPKASPDGKIIACLGPETKITDEDILGLVPCQWGRDGIVSPQNPSRVFLKTIPIDPRHESGFDYLYLTNARWFQIYASLEGKGEDEYDPKIESRNLKCGKAACNFGKSYTNIPLDKSFEEYENEL